jgi:hypothetical protein
MKRCDLSHRWTGRSGDYIRHDPIRELLDFIFQGQFALLHPGKFKLVAIAGRSEKLDFQIKSAMLGFEKFQHFARIVIVHRYALQQGRIIVTQVGVIGQPRGPSAEPMRNTSDKPLIS